MPGKTHRGNDGPMIGSPALDDTIIEHFPVAARENVIDHERQTVCRPRGPVPPAGGATTIGPAPVHDPTPGRGMERVEVSHRDGRRVDRREPP